MGAPSKPCFFNLRDCPVSLPRYYGGVILVGVGSFGLHFYLASRVLKARKEIDFPCPNTYHPTNIDFNCIQRAHQNYLEVMPVFLSSLFVGGLYCPIGATVLGAVYLIGRVVYFKGYTSGNPANRKQGMFGFVALMLLMGLNAFFGFSYLATSLKCSQNCPRLRYK